MDFGRFVQTDWEEIADRLAQREGGFDKSSFAGWLVQHGEALDLKFGTDQWTLGQALTEAAGNTKEKRAPKRAKKSLAGKNEEKILQESEDVVFDGEAYEGKVFARVMAYESKFTDVTENDRALLRALVNAELASERMNWLLQQELVQELPNADRIQKLNAALANANANQLSIQKQLGIDKLTRDKQKEDRGDVDEVLDIIEEAGAFVEANGILLQHHCGEYLGMLVTAFREFRWDITVEKCPLCNAENVKFTHEPDKDDVKAVEPTWVKQEEAKFQHTWHTEGEE